MDFDLRNSLAIDGSGNLIINNGQIAVTPALDVMAVSASDDLGQITAWKFAEQQGLTLRREVFNVTNSVRFDAALSPINEALTDSGSFGKYQATLTQSRRMQLSLRYSF
jgi:hypothetical protein